MILGKALGNGYAITSVLGKNRIMKNIKNTFISSTFWTERIGSVAALKTLEVMENTKSWKKITKIGNEIRKNWKRIAKKNNLEILIAGIPALSSFSFKSKHNNFYKTLITKEMLKKGFLASNSIYTSIAHNKKILKIYYQELDNVFKKIKEIENSNNIKKYLTIKESTKSFARLN
jgi:glutamate-1-semialdehyde 2,1-aminomutase